MSEKFERQPEEKQTMEKSINPEKERSEIKEAMSNIGEAQLRLSQASGRLFDTPGVKNILDRIISLTEQVGEVYKELNDREQGLS